VVGLLLVVSGIEIVRPGRVIDKTSLFIFKIESSRRKKGGERGGEYLGVGMTSPTVKT